MDEVKFEELNNSRKELVISARKVLETAYNPYSNFYVGASLRDLKEGKIFTGSNVENSAYGSTICAERAAILSANAQGYRAFSSLAIVARGKDFETSEVTAPCGACRQNLYETSQIAGEDLEIILSTTKGEKIILTSINELLPLAFGPLDLGINVSRFR